MATSSTTASSTRGTARSARTGLDPAGERRPAGRAVRARRRPDLHTARIDGATDDRGADSLTSRVSTAHAVISGLRFDIEDGPFVDGDTVVLRWIASGRYVDGSPGATAATGTGVRFTGTDILRVSDDRVAEYRVDADLHVLLAQLGVLAG